MKAVAPHARFVQLLGDREATGDRGHGAVEGGVEAGHLRERRVELPHEADGAEVVRLVQRRERDEGLEPRQHRVVHPHRRREHDSPVHHPVAHAGQGAVPEGATDEGQEVLQGARVAEIRVLRPVLLRCHGAVRPARDEVRRAFAHDPLELAAHVRRKLAASLEEERELDGR